MIKLDVHIVQEYNKLKTELEEAYRAYEANEINDATYQMALDKFNSYCIYAIANMVGDDEMAEVYKENY